MFTDDLPLHTADRAASALIMRGLLFDWSLFRRMYRHSLLTISVRVTGPDPTTAASFALGVRGFQNFDRGFLRRFMCLPPWTGGEICRRERKTGTSSPRSSEKMRSLAALGMTHRHSQLSAPPVWYSVTRVSKKFFSFLRSMTSLIHGNGFSAPGYSCLMPICAQRRLAMNFRYSLNWAAFRPSTPRGMVSCA